MIKALNILGIRGIPAAHGGFETFAADLAPFLRDNGWKVTVYCQEEGGASHPRCWLDEWEGIQRVHFDTRSRGAMATVEFDLRCIFDVLRRPGIDLVLGYNTAVFVLIQRIAGRKVIMNMDGIEWKRGKWGRLAKLWFWINEWFGAFFSTIAIADHPEIARHLANRGCSRSVVIPYGAKVVDQAPTEVLETYKLTSGEYLISIARIEPENSVFEIVQAFVSSQTAHKLVILGTFAPSTNQYHALIETAANDDVIFVGPIYDAETVRALRYHCLAYMHGHQVGGTNPSLVEALGAGSPVIAHDNRFNRWTAGEGALFFRDAAECASRITELSKDTNLRKRMSGASRIRHKQAFTFEAVRQGYLKVITT